MSYLCNSLSPFNYPYTSDGMRGVRRWGGGAGAGEETAGLVEGDEIEGVRGQLDIGDDVVLNGKRQFHPTPVELGGTLGGERTPAAILPFGRCEFFVKCLHLGAGDNLTEGNLGGCNLAGLGLR